MRIRLDETHWLNSDAQCCWVTEEKISKEGKLYERTVSGYLPTFEMLMDNYIKKTINSSEAVTLTQLAQEIKDLKKEIRTWQVNLESLTQFQSSPSQSP